MDKPKGILMYVLLSSVLSEPAFISMSTFTIGIIAPLVLYHSELIEINNPTLIARGIITIIYLSCLLAICRFISFGKCLPGGMLKNKSLMKGKTVVITGCTRGIGLETAKQLASWGVSELIMCCRDIVAMESAKSQLLSNGLPLNRVHSIECELSSLQSIKLCSRKIFSIVDKIDILINNAGVMAPPFQLINQVERQFMTNYLGHYYLTMNLMPLLQKSKSRIINVSSIAHLAAPFGFDISELENVNRKNYDRTRFYGISKLCNIYFTRELQKRFGSFGLFAVALHPGCVNTDLGRYIKEGSTIFVLFYPLMKLFSKTPFSGAQTTLYCCAIPDEKLIPGGYYSQCALDISSPVSLDMDVSEKLWDYSRILCEKIINSEIK
ncbi:short-chain dehydrogenase family protein [Cryptosporidium ubiquitum]|uniref:Short-chain dehydrogenase family protein n=1 Tax=Cryptosporidium ubiquitum TaxID=857276 RepID=A0A1J4MCV4_9CRYT|nr:short-chain dehydrogenase family protein [Cryptosporidium ubiquitum]OII72054.1 short-chain dehydrogenase family protein [Cryptosporidium ubiquitum]